MENTIIHFDEVEQDQTVNEFLTEILTEKFEDAYSMEEQDVLNKCIEVARSNGLHGLAQNFVDQLETPTHGAMIAQQLQSLFKSFDNR